LTSAAAADKALLDILLENGVVTQEQYDELMEQETLTSEDILGTPEPDESVASTPASPETEEYIETAVADALAEQIEEEFTVNASHGSSGFRLETRDGKWQTNLQWRAQFRYYDNYSGDPRQLDDFSAPEVSNFENRRLRMKIGGHGFEPWLRYYFEIDLQPSRDPDATAITSSARVIDWRVDVAKWDWGGIRLGQWKIDMNRERVDSSGRQQFVERSIVNRVFTIDRQVGIQLRGHLFKETAADMRYYVGAFSGGGRGVRNESNDLMYSGRLQWNFLGRDLPWQQTDVEFTEQPTASLAIGGATTQGPCTRWSSSGCGRLDGFASPITAGSTQFKVEQAVQEFHRKFIDDRVEGTRSDLTGAYLQAGYFFNNIIDAVPAPLELAVRYAFVEEPNEVNRMFENERTELTFAANWFFAGHNNKITVDYSFLTMDDGLTGLDDDGNRLRLQWDVSF
jgi:hypothetical protein